VRLVELTAPLVDIQLPRSSGGRPYRSLLALPRLFDDPIGAATVPVDRSGLVSRDCLERELRSQLGGDLREALARRELAPSDAETPTRRRSVSVVVTTCCSPVALERCLRSILQSDHGDFEVIVVENRPRSPATRRMLAERFPGEPRLRYVEEPRQGLSRARNAGLAVADGDVVAFTDDDVVVDPAWVGRCAKAFDRESDVACATGLILPLELETETQLLLEQFAGFGKGFRPVTHRLPEARDLQPLFPYTPGAIGSGANTALRSDVARALGGFAASLGAGTAAVGGEDLDLYIRVLREGHAIAYEPSAIVWHHHPDGEARLRRQVYRYGVGLGATLARQLLVGPERGELIRAVPAGVRYARDPTSRKNASKPPDFPQHLDWLERVGMLVGPAAYMVSACAATYRCIGEPPRPVPVAGQSLHPIELPSGRVTQLVSFRDGEPDAPPVAARRAAVARARERLQRADPGSASVPQAVLTAVAAAACVAAPLLVALGLPVGLRLPAVLALLSLAPGTALLTALRGRAELGLAIGASLSVSAVLAQTMLWLGTWWPTAFLYGLAAICLPPLVAALDVGAVVQPLRLQSVRRALGKISPFAVGHAVLLGGALAVWGASLAEVDLNRIDGFGLVSALPPAYFIALALLLVGLASALERRDLNRQLLWLYALALILVLHGTAPLLYDEPRYAWTYKHLGVIDLIGATGSVDRQIDIYNNWPAFFAGNAWFSHAAGLAPIAYAGWAQVFFNVANVAALRFALRGLTRDERVLWTATVLFLLANWVGQDYLGPQSLGFVLSLVVLGLCVRNSPRTGRAGSLPGRWLEAVRDRLAPKGAARERPPAPATLSPSGAVVAGAVCYLAVVVTHQLSPLLLLTSVTGLALLTRRVPLWVPAAMAAVEVWWLVLAWPYLTDHFSLLDFDPAQSTAPAGAHGLPGVELVALSARALIVIVVVLAAIGLFRRYRQGLANLAPATLVLAPVALVLIQTYGGEGRFRAYLFALPWLSFFAAWACAPKRSGAAAWRSWRLALACAATGTCFVFAYFGLEMVNRMTRDDVAAALWFDRHAPRGSLLVGLTPNFPNQLTARYARTHDPALPGNHGLSVEPGFPPRRFHAADLPRLEGTLGSYGVRHTFLSLTSSQERYGRLFGVLAPDSRRSLEVLLRQSPSFRPVYRRGSATIFEYRSPGRGGASP
jgi:GT2 family glycosyltransferase